MYRLKDYQFELPKGLIARYPADRREEARLLVVERGCGTIRHAAFADFPGIVPDDSFLVVNDTKVIPVRLFATMDGRPVEMLLVGWRDKRSAEVLARPAARMRPGRKLEVTSEITAEVEAALAGGRWLVRFSVPAERVLHAGYAPLPPYIKRSREEAEKLRSFDLARYQTVYARHAGAIAAPTAGMHFTAEMLEEVRTRFPVLEITLQVGEATFRKISSPDIRDHRMGKETVRIEKKTLREIQRLKKGGKKLLAVGTTSVRALESQAALRPGGETFETDLFIYPGFSFRVVDRLLTNFHLPESTLFILVAAFAGLDLVKEAYRVAIKNKYRFFSYGDAMLIL